MEFAFSLSPNEITKTYELWTTSLDEKITAINELLKRWFRVWLRFLPLLPINNFEEIYWKFLDKVISEIDINKISSITIAPLIYNQWDYNKITKIYQKDKDFSFVNNLQKNENNLRTCSN